jgi:VanZ family protein
MDKRNTVFPLIIFLSLSVLWTAFIFGNSLQDRESSKEQSGTVKKVVAKVLDTVGMEYDNSSLEFVIRKSAHALEFAVQAILLTLTARSAKKPMKSCAIYVLFICLLSAVIDEYIQLFTAGRGSSAADILLDFTGASAGLLVFCILHFILNKRKKHNSGGGNYSV